MANGLEVTAFQMNNKKRWLVKCKWAVGFINRSREFVMDQEQTEWLIANLRPGEERRLLTHYRDELVKIGAWGVKVEKTETPATPLIKPPPAVVPGNTGVRKVETAKLAEPKKKAKAKAEPKAEAKAEPNLADMFALLSNMNAAVQSLSGRMDAMEDAATQPASAGAGPDF